MSEKIVLTGDACLGSIHRQLAELGAEHVGYIDTSFGWSEEKEKYWIRYKILRTMKSGTRNFALRTRFEKMLSSHRDACDAERYYYMNDGYTLWFRLRSEKKREESAA